MLIIRWLGNTIFRKETMGIGDVKLSALIGLFVGIENFLFAVWSAAIIGCLYWLFKRFIMVLPIEDPARGKDIKLPFGSFLSLTSFAALLLSPIIQGLIIKF